MNGLSQERYARNCSRFNVGGSRPATAVGIGGADVGSIYGVQAYRPHTVAGIPQNGSGTHSSHGVIPFPPPAAAAASATAPPPASPAAVPAAVPEGFSAPPEEDRPSTAAV